MTTVAQRVGGGGRRGIGVVACAVVAAFMLDAWGFTALHARWYGQVMPSLGDPPMDNPRYEALRWLSVQAWSCGGPLLGGIAAGLIMGWRGMVAGVAGSGCWALVMLGPVGWHRSLFTTGGSLATNEPLAMLVWLIPGAVAGAAIGALLRTGIARWRQCGILGHWPHLHRPTS